MNVTNKLSEWVVQASYADFPDRDIEISKGLLLKTVAALVAGCRMPIGKKLTTYLASVGGTPEAGVVGGGFKTSVENAAFAHGTFAHAPELEDDRIPGIVGTCWVFPAFFALGEKLSSSGREILEATMVSWEVTARLCLAAPGPAMIAKSRTFTPVWFGIVGAAAGAARLQKLSSAETQNAMGIAACHASGMWGSGGADSHFLESGHCCRVGVLSAILAKAGATGHPLFLEGKDGLYREIWKEGSIDFGVITNGLGKSPFDIGNIWVKKYSCCMAAHASIDALAALMREHDIKYEAIEMVEAQVERHSADVLDRQPVSLATSAFSIYYCLGQVLLKGTVELDDFTRIERLHDPRIQEAQRKIKLVVPPDWDLPHRVEHDSRVIVYMKDGRTFEKYLEQPIGAPKYPLTIEQVAEFSRPYLDMGLTKDHRQRVHDIAMNLEKQPDINELMNILTYFRI